MCDFEQYGDCHNVHLRCDECPRRQRGRLNTSEIDAIDDALSRLADTEGGAYESALVKIKRRRYRRRRVAKSRKAPSITQHQRELLRLLRFGDFVFDAGRGLWRFGTRRIADPAVADLIERGIAFRTGDRVTLDVHVVERTTIAPALDLENPAAKRKERA
ncbi:MAG: hypothetical protein WBB98_13295 [Xanthobacteraceae bacterium]